MTERYPVEEVVVEINAKTLATIAVKSRTEIETQKESEVDMYWQQILDKLLKAAKEGRNSRGFNAAQCYYHWKPEHNAIIVNRLKLLGFTVTDGCGSIFDIRW